MKLLTINYSGSRNLFLKIFRKLLKIKLFEDCNISETVKILEREKPFFVLTSLREPVNGDEDMMAMLSSSDVNTRLRVYIINTETVTEPFNTLKERLKHFILPGHNSHKLETP